MANVTFSPNHQPAPACYPSDVNHLLDLLTTGGGLSGTIPDTAGGGVYVGSTPPSSALTNKVWYKTDAAGRPLGAYMFYNGNWRKVYTGIAVGDIKAWFGSNGLFDSNGLGVIGSDIDGWCQCNGNYGTPDLRNKFVACAQGFSNGQWVTNVDGSLTTNGGSPGPHYIGPRLLPKLETATYGNANAPTGGGGITMANVGAAPLAFYYPVVDANGAPVDGVNQQPIPSYPFYALMYLMFVGY